MNEHWRGMPVVRGFESVDRIFQRIKGLGYISGSYAAFMAAPIMTPILPNDVDVFAISDKAAETIQMRLVARENWYTTGASKVAFTMAHKRHDFTVQIVKPHPDWKIFPDDYMGAFDMDVCRAVLLTPDTVLADKNVGDLQAKLLLINDPLRSLKRVMKYNARGVQLKDSELIKLFLAWDMATPERKAQITAIAQQQADDPEEVIDVRQGGSDGWDYDEDDYYNGE